MLSIFSPEISSLESQVDALQAQIVQAQERINQLGECETQADSAIQALQDAVTRIAGLAPSAVAALKASVLNLFNSGNDSNDGGQPVGNGGPSPLTPAHTPVMYANSRTSTPAPGAAVSEPSADSNREQHAIGQVVVLPEQLVASAVMEVSATLSADATELTGQCCQMEDAPEEALVGQVYELCCPLKQNVVAVYEDSIKQSPTIEEVAVSIAAEDSLFKLIEVTPLLSYMKRNSDGMIAATYIGFNSKSRAKMWSEWLSLTHSVATKTEVRVAKRLSTFKYELKCSGVSFKSIERLAQCDFGKDPRIVYSDAPAIKPERVPTNAEIDDFKAGDVVKNVSIKNWTYTVLGVKDDGFLEVERISVNPPIRTTINPASVELIRRGGVVEIVSQELAEHLEQQALDSLQQPAPLPARIDIDDVPAGTRLFLSSDDILVQFEVWMQVEVRVGGRIQKQQREIGKLLETSLGIEARRSRRASVKLFNRTLDAVSYLVSGSSFKPTVPAQTPVLIGAGADTDDYF